MYLCIRHYQYGKGLSCQFCAELVQIIVRDVESVLEFGSPRYFIV